MQTSSDLLLFKAFAVWYMWVKTVQYHTQPAITCTKSEKKYVQMTLKTHAKTAMNDIFSVNCQVQQAWKSTEKISFIAAFHDF